MINIQVLKIQGIELKIDDFRGADFLNLLAFENDQNPTPEKAAEALKIIVGEKRLERIFKRQEKDFKALNEGRFAITRKSLHEIIVGMADIRFEDIEDVGGDKAATETIDELYNALLPKKKLRDLFKGVSQDVNYYDKVRVSGDSSAAAEQRVWAILEHKESLSSTSKTPGTKEFSTLEFEDFELLSSRLADREPPIGTLVKLSSGYFTAEKIVSGGGAYVTIWKSVSNDRPPIIVCRGTAFGIRAVGGIMSGVNDLLPEIGFYGVRTIWQELKEYLKENEIRFVEVFGKSLGGAHAQYLTALIMGLTETSVSVLKTNCSLGTPESVQESFNEALTNPGKDSPLIEVYRNIGDTAEVDFIPFLGGCHLSSPNTKFIYAAPVVNRLSEDGAKGIKEDVENFHGFKSLWQKLKGLASSFDKAHSRQNSLKAYALMEGGDISVESKVGTKLEPVRAKIADIFNFCTFYTFDTETFEEFYKNQIISK